MATSRELQSKDLQECISLIRKMTTIIDPTDDYLTITAAEEQMNVNYAQGKKDNEEAYANLKSRSRVLDAARKSSARPSSVPTVEQNATLLNELDASRISLAKSMRDAESSVASKEAELAALKEIGRKLEESDPAHDHQCELDGQLLRLKIYKGIGFEPVLHGNDSKMLIRGELGDVHCVSPDVNNFRKVNLVWELVISGD